MLVLELLPPAGTEPLEPLGTCGHIIDPPVFVLLPPARALLVKFCLIACFFMFSIPKLVISEREFACAMLVIHGICPPPPHGATVNLEFPPFIFFVI